MSESEIREIINKLDAIKETVIELRITQVHNKEVIEKLQQCAELLTREGCEVGRRQTEQINDIRSAIGEIKTGKMAHIIGWPTVGLAIIYLIAKAHGIEIPIP